MIQVGVINVRSNWSTRHVCRVDRSSAWGNPFKIGRDGSRLDVLRDHEHWLREQPELLQEIYRLRYKTLGCFCDPLPCHGWLLAYLANGTWEQVFEWHTGDIYWTDSRFYLPPTFGTPGWL